MQKTVFAIALALTLTCALAAYTPENFVKQPVPVCNDGDTNFTNQTALTIGSLGLKDLNLISVFGKPVDPQNPTNISFTLWTRKLDNKALTQGANTTYTFTAPVDIDYVNGYVYYFSTAADAGNNTQLYVSQVKLDGNSQLPKFALTTNTNSTFKPQVLGGYTAGNTVYIYYLAALRVVNVTSFTAGGSAMGKVFNVTTNYDGNLAVAGGDALTSSQSLAIWNEGDALKEGLVDGSKGTVTLTANPLGGGYNKSVHTCYPYVTDKKLYGTLCKAIINGTQIQVLVRTNSSNLLPLYTANVSDSTEVTHFPYAGYWAFVYQATPSTGVQTLTTEIWDLEKFTTFKPRTKFLTINPSNSTQQIYRVPSGGVFVLLYNNKAQDNATLTGVQAGLLLGSSYLASVFGFLLTIIAGLFLF